MVTDHRLNSSETFPSIQHWLGGQYGYNLVDNYRQLLEEEDKTDQFLNKHIYVSDTHSQASFSLGLTICNWKGKTVTFVFLPLFLSDILQYPFWFK